MKFYRRYGKRAVDLGLAVPLVILSSPLLVLIGLTILLDDGLPIIFRQVRVGASGRQFVINKFRSLKVASEEVPSHLGHDLEPTRAGRFLRRTNLDELPQLFNILRGDMSIVGPRPPLPTQVPVIEGRRSCGAWTLRPGVTGLAQVESYDDMSPDEKVRWDCIYADQLSFKLDLVILMRTFSYLVKPPPTY